MDDKIRYHKEREFHNKSLGETRKGASKFYAITSNSRAFHKRVLQSHCKNKNVLEYGCGTGTYAFFLAKRGAIVTGIDISNKRIEQAKQTAVREQLDKKITFLVMNAEAMDFDNNTFDLIFGGAILHHLDINKSFSEITRTLKPDGTAIFVEPLGHNPLINFYRKKTPQMRTDDEHPLLMKDLKMAEEYFGKVEGHFFHITSLLAVPFRNFPGFTCLLNLLNTIDSILFKLFPFLRKYAWQVVIVLSQPKK